VDWTLAILAFIVIQGFLLLKCVIDVARLIESGLEELDSNLGIAISQVVENFSIGSGEPINPIQQALAQMLTNSIKPKESGVIEVLQGENGQFIKKE
tara:strand:- start:155 stop:445 length:291 start_codon:yes stop_codon:yes gene_type:complete